MNQIKPALAKALNKASRIIILGIGSELMGDDIAGPLFARNIEKMLKKNKNHPAVKVIDAGPSPENFTGEIKKFMPSHVIIIDAADFKKEPGYISLINREDIDGASFSTHRLPSKIMIDYLIKSCGCRVLVIGIQPKTIVFGEKPSKELKKAVTDLSKIIKEVLCTKAP